MKQAPSTSWPPRGLTGLLVRRLVPAGADPSATASRTALGEFEGYVSTAISVVLSLTKAVLGWIAGSVSLVADAVNNLADIGTSLVIALGFRWSSKPRDREHPFGHGRVETVITLILAIALVGVGFEVARAGVGRLLNPRPCHAPWWLTATVIVTVVVKGWLALFARTLAKATRSQVLEADAWNHTFDIASTALVVVALLGTALGWPRLDGFAAVGVSLFIAWTGIRYLRSSVHTLIGEAPSADDLARVRSTAAAVAGVRGVHDVIVHAYGDVRHISLHIEVDSNLTVLAAHTLAEAVEARIAEALGAKTTVHVDPVDRAHACYLRAEKALVDAVQRGDLVGFHDLRVSGPESALDVQVDLVVTKETLTGEFQGRLEAMRRRLQAELPGLHRADLGIETEYSSEQEFRREFIRPAP